MNLFASFAANNLLWLVYYRLVHGEPELFANTQVSDHRNAQHTSDTRRNVHVSVHPTATAIRVTVCAVVAQRLCALLRFSYRISSAHTEKCNANTRSGFFDGGIVLQAKFAKFATQFVELVEHHTDIMHCALKETDADCATSSL